MPSTVSCSEFVACWDLEIYGDGLDEHLGRVNGATPRNREYYLTQTDGSVYMTADSAGHFQEMYRYSAYGERRSTTPSGGTISGFGADVIFGFQGQYQNRLSGAVNMRSRWYLPSWGRFLSPDPIGFAGGSNLYAFVDSAPLRYTDPFGLSPVQSNLAQRLTSSYWQELNAASRNQAFGPGQGALDRITGLINYAVTTPIAATESVSNLPGAFVGNIVDQARLRGAGLDIQADIQADIVGKQLQTGILNLGVAATSGLVGQGLNTTSVITIDATSAFGELEGASAVATRGLANAGPIARSLGAASRAEMIAKKVGLNINSPTSRQVLNSLDMRVTDFIGKFRAAGIRGRFPSEFLDKTAEEALTEGGSTVRKLLTDGRFVK